MSTRDVGDRIAIRHEVRDPDGTLTAATVAVTVTAPDGGTTTLSVTTGSTGIYDAAFVPDEAGTWRWTWSVSGAVVEVAYGQVAVGSPGPMLYASVPDLKVYLGLEEADDVVDDALILDALTDCSREIDAYCDRRFYADTTASARTFDSRGCTLFTDDIWTTTGLEIDGSAWPVTGVTLEPRNGVADGIEGWPYTRVVGTYPWSARTGVTVTARWGWAAVPAAVRQACLILAAETLKLKDAPFGVGGYGEFGIVRARDNPFAARKLSPYRRHPAVAL